MKRHTHISATLSVALATMLLSQSAISVELNADNEREREILAQTSLESKEPQSIKSRDKIDSALDFTNNTNTTTSTNATATTTNPANTSQDLPPQSISSNHSSQNTQDDLDTQASYKNLEAKDLGKVSASAPKREMNRENAIFIDKEDLANKGYADLEQALSHQASITLTPSANGQRQIDIRGQGLDAIKSVKTYINGVPININDTGYGASRNGFSLNGANPFNLIDINDIESIEVLAGGGSVLYGSGTRGGVVNIITKKPSKNYGRVSLEGVAYEAKEALSGKASVGGGYNIKDKAFISANVSYAYKNGLRPREYTKNAYASLQASYQISEKHKLDFSANYAKSYQFFAGYNNKFINGTQEKSISAMKQERYSTPTQATLNGVVMQDLVQASLKYSADFSQHLGFSALGFYSFSDFAFPEISGDPTIANANITGTNSNHNAGVFLKLKHSTKNNKLYVGLDNNVEISSANSGSSDKREGVRYSGGVYLLDSFMPSKYFSLTGGARGEVVYYDVDRTAVTSFANPPTNIVSVGSRQDIKANYAAEITPAFHYGEAGTLYAKGEIGFISPSVAQIINAISTSNTSKEFAKSNIKPEQYFTGEIGWRDEFLFSSFSASAYYTHSFNEIRYIYQTAVRNFFNLGETQRFGFEFVGKQRLFDKILSLQESINFNYSNVLKGRDETAAFNAKAIGASDASQEGKQIPYVPIVKVSLLANVQAIKVGKHSLNIFYNNSYYGQQVDNNYALMNRGGYVLGDIGFTYAYNGFSISAGVRNVYDSFYVAYQSSSSPATRTYLAGEGRSYYIAGKWEF